MANKFYIGIDLGTSACKLLLVSADGEAAASAVREYPVSFPENGWSEQRPEDWKAAVFDGIAELAAAAKRLGGEVASIGVGGQMHGLVMLDGAGDVIRPAILWNDGRSARECEYLNGTVGSDFLLSRTANIAFAGFTAPKLLWVREHEPENFARAKKILLPKDYIVHALTGGFFTDASDASGTLYYDVERRRWSPEMLSLCGIDEGMLPRVYESSDVVGEVSASVADALGLPRGVLVVAGAGDNAAAAVGTGTVGDGACSISLGTSGTVFVARDDPSPGGVAGGVLHSFAHANGRWHLLGCMLSAASCNKWWCETVLGTRDFASEQAGISDGMLGHGDVFFLPYLMGERAPHNDPSARGAFLGLGMGTTRAELTLAVLEGVAFSLCEITDIARRQGDITRAALCGGGAKSPLWCRVMANVLGIEVFRPEKEEGPAYGAAILAAVGAGEFATVDEGANAFSSVKDVFTPSPDLASRYAEKYARFLTLYPTVKSLWG